MDQFGGHWLVDKSLTTGIEPMLKLQGISWPLRKAATLGTTRLKIVISTDEKAGVVSSDTLYTLTGGLAGATEKRVFDWTLQNHKDYLYGACQYQARIVYGGLIPGILSGGAGSPENGVVEGGKEVYPEFEMQTKLDDERVRKFLRGQLFEDGTSSSWTMPEAENEGGNVWVHTFMWSLTAGWTVEQIWGFEEIAGEVYQTRRTVAADAKGQYTLGRFVFKRE
ncbi:hypothetical protein BJX70DRAFT_393544 [Aspergillus crustosus]